MPKEKFKNELDFMYKLNYKCKTIEDVKINYNLFKKLCKKINVDELSVLRNAEIIFRNAGIFIEDITLSNVNELVLKTLTYANEPSVPAITAVPLLGYIYKRCLSQDEEIDYNKYKEEQNTDEQSENR